MENSNLGVCLLFSFFFFFFFFSFSFFFFFFFLSFPFLSLSFPGVRQINAGCTNIYVGEVLCVDTTVYAYSDASYYSAEDGAAAAVVVSAAGGDAGEQDHSEYVDEDDIPYCE
jgi:hypothetical protein